MSPPRRQGPAENTQNSKPHTVVFSKGNEGLWDAEEVEEEEGDEGECRQGPAEITQNITGRHLPQETRFENPFLFDTNVI